MRKLIRAVQKKNPSLAKRLCNVLSYTPSEEELKATQNKLEKLVALLEDVDALQMDIATDFSDYDLWDVPIGKLFSNAMEKVGNIRVDFRRLLRMYPVWAKMKMKGQK